MKCKGSSLIAETDNPVTKVTKERGRRSKLIKLEMKMEKLSRDNWRRRGVKTSETVASPGLQDFLEEWRPGGREGEGRD
jgi:hypothetical protein